jgi:hypothetical protein
LLPVRQTCPHTLALLQRRQRRHQPCPLLRADRCRPSKVAACSVGRAAWLRSPPVTRDTPALLAVWRPSSTTSSSTRASACPCRKLDRCCGARCARGIACRSDLALSGCAQNELPALVPSRKSAHSRQHAAAQRRASVREEVAYPRSDPTTGVGAWRSGTGPAGTPACGSPSCDGSTTHHELGF